MYFGNLWIWKIVENKHGNNGHEGLRKVMTDNTLSESDIRKKYPELDSRTIAIINLIYKMEEIELKVDAILNELTFDKNIPNEKDRQGKHRGLFMVVDEYGNYTEYKKGDIVTYNNKTYIANKNIEVRMGPLHENSGWKEITPDIVDGGEFN